MKAYLLGSKIIHKFSKLGGYSNCGFIWIENRNLRGSFRFKQVGRFCKRCK